MLQRHQHCWLAGWRTLNASPMRLNLYRFPGGLKERSAERQLEKDPTEVLRKAVYGMLPKNKLRDVRILLSLLHYVCYCFCCPICLAPRTL